MKRSQLITGIMVLAVLIGVPAYAAEGDSSGQYMQENAKNLALADQSFTDAQYDDAVTYAQESIKYAQMSDVMAARARMDYAEKSGAEKNYPEVYQKVQAPFAAMQEASSKDDWENAGKSALQVLDILSILPSRPVLAAQYRVQSWTPMRDCLWNIAGKPEIYGDPFQWRAIYDANKSKLPKPDDPNLLEPGLILDIPSIKGESRSGILESD